MLKRKIFPFKAPFGLCAIPLVFARLIDEVLRGTKHHFTQSFLDAILIYSSTFKDHIKHIIKGFTIEPRKTQFARKEITYIGYIFTKNGIKTDPSTIEKVKHFPVPKNIRDVIGFLASHFFYKRFIFRYATIIRPLNNRLNKQIVFEWYTEANTAFETLRVD